MANRRSLIAGNWKMNGLSAGGSALASAVSRGIEGLSSDVLVCPPAPLIHAVVQVVGGSALKVGGQDCHAGESGAHTGDVSAEMLGDLGASYVIVGHSERRTDHGETDLQVKEKALAAHRAGLTAIICIGETGAERDQGQALSVLSTQIDGSVPREANAGNTVIAYEPVWAIGTGHTPTIDDIAGAHAHIRGYLATVTGIQNADGIRLLYGGSMKPGNAAEILSIDNVDGGLIGGASLKAEDFLSIAAAAG